MRHRLIIFALSGSREKDIGHSQVPPEGFKPAACERLGRESSCAWFTRPGVRARGTFFQFTKPFFKVECY